MYWLFSLQEQEQVRQKVTALADSLATGDFPRVQADQIFPFSGRKDRQIANCILQQLLSERGTVCEPFMGSGIFTYAALDNGHKVTANEWEPYAQRLSTAAFLPTNAEQIESAKEQLHSQLELRMNDLYKTTCVCGHEHVVDSLFFDRETQEYFHPQPHERMGPNGENVTYRGRYRCPTCRRTEKMFDVEDEAQMRRVEEMAEEGFPDVELIENSRINLTAPQFTTYSSLFPKRSRVALGLLFSAIRELENEKARAFMLNALLCILPQAKYTDYRAKSQDLHCPPLKNRENNIWHRFIQKIEERRDYIENFPSVGVVQNWESLQQSTGPSIMASCADFRDFLTSVPDASCDLVITDPPYGDAVPYFEKAQLFHPFLSYSLKNDENRLAKEVVITNAPSRTDKHSREQFLNDIEQMFEHISKVLKSHSYFVLYFRPEQGHWIRDLNTLKLYGRKYGLEPLMTIDATTNDPSMRVLASTAWTFASDVVFLFIKLNENERRWYENDEDIDCLIYSAALQASGGRGESFTTPSFNEKLVSLVREKGVPQVIDPRNRQRIQDTLLRFCSQDGALFTLSGVSPYQDMHHAMDPEIRVREFIPVVVEELTAEEGQFKFHKFVLRLSTYLDNGSRSIISRLNNSEGRLRQMLLEHTEIDPETGLLRARTPASMQQPAGTQDILNLDPYDFEQLVGELLRRQGFSNVNVIGRSCDRGVDVLAKGPGEEVYIIQCKRYRPGNNIGSSPIQRVDSYKRTRGAQHAWVITTSDFTREGASEASIANVRTINGTELMELLNVYFPNRYFIPSQL
jgi:restriction system protein